MKKTIKFKSPKITKKCKVRLEVLINGRWVKATKKHLKDSAELKNDTV